MRFILIDAIERLELGKTAEGYKFISPDDDYFDDHFPGYPVVPGVLVLESLVQLGGRLVGATVRSTTGRRLLPMLAKVESAKFLRAVRPGDRLDLAVNITGVSENAGGVTGVAHVAGVKVASAKIMYAMVDVGPEGGLLDSEKAETLRQWSDNLWTRFGQEPR